MDKVRDRYSPDDNEPVTPDTQMIVDLVTKFVSAPFLFTQEEAETTTQLYVEHIAGVKWGEEDMYNKIGKNSNGVGIAKDDHKTFWAEVGKVVPDFLTKQELEWLIEKDERSGGAFKLLFDLAYYPCESDEPSVVMSYIHSWK